MDSVFPFCGEECKIMLAKKATIMNCLTEFVAFISASKPKRQQIIEYQ